MESYSEMKPYVGYKVDCSCCLGTFCYEHDHLILTTPLSHQSSVRMESFINLQSSFNTLHQANNKCQCQGSRSNQEWVSLHAFASVIPPLTPRSGFRFVKDLLQDNETVAPVLELIDLPVLSSQLTASASIDIKASQ